MRNYVLALAVATIAFFIMADKASAASMGVKVEEVGAKEAKKLALEPGLGLKVTDVRDGHPADKAGIKVGMIIISIDGMEIKSDADLVAAMEKAGSKAKVTVITEDGWEEKSPRRQNRRPHRKNVSLPYERNHPSLKRATN
ncbi:MAG: PDZ domain-containing protein [Planctomycetota bacterium]